MANTCTCLFYHIVFSTKNRDTWIAQEYEDRIWAYLGGIAKEIDATPIRIGGVSDHVHLVVRAPPTIAPSELVKTIKGGSSRWIHQTFPKLSGFAWQDGFGAFTVSKSKVPEVVEYVAGQREHHRTRTFQEEYRALLNKHELDYDERYVWG